MKEKITNANFPKDKEDRVYHMGIKLGQVANRILTVGDPERARKIAKLLDSQEKTGHVLFEKQSARGFLTITGRYKGVPVSIIAIGMGTCMMDFFVRETRACVDGTMAIIRFGSCGSLSQPPGAIIVPKAGYVVRRNFDYFAHVPFQTEIKNVPYLFSGLFEADKDMVSILTKTLKSTVKEHPILADVYNAEACSFYSSQARQDDSFWDDNQDIFNEIKTHYPKTASIEMEASTLFHLAHCSSRKNTDKQIKAASCMQVFADRVNNDFITPDQVASLEPVVGKACLDALIQIEIENEMSEKGTVWEDGSVSKSKRQRRH